MTKVSTVTLTFPIYPRHGLSLVMCQICPCKVIRVFVAKRAAIFQEVMSASLGNKAYFAMYFSHSSSPRGQSLVNNPLKPWAYILSLSKRLKAQINTEQVKMGRSFISRPRFSEEECTARTETAALTQSAWLLRLGWRDFTPFYSFPKVLLGAAFHFS